MESSMCKIFVGNVPFQCGQVEFTECFEKMAGFIKAEIIYKLGTTISRGFGFVTFDSPENARDLLHRTISFKDRPLRFTQYVANVEGVEEKIVVPFQCGQSECTKNLIIVKNVGKMTREDIFIFFSNFGLVGKHFIVSDHETGILKSYAIVEMLEKDVFDCLLKVKEINHESEVLEISRFRPKKCSKEKQITKNDLFNAFIAGKNLGMIEAFKKKPGCVLQNMK